MQVGVVTDSTCDLPAATLRRIRVEAVPLRIVVGDETYRDWRDLDPGTLYDWMQNQGVIPVVRSPEPEDFMEAYRRTFQRFENLISIHVSPQFSRTLENARLAAQRLGIEEKVRFIDSGQAGAGLAEMVIEAARLAREGATVESVCDTVEQMRENLYGVFSPTGDGWLKTNGFLSGLRERRHKLLQHRPLISMDSGRLARIGWDRSTRIPAALAAALRARFGEQPLRVTIAYGGADQNDLTRLRTAMETGGLHIAHGRMQLIGPAVGARLGPGSAMVSARPVVAS